MTDDAPEWPKPRPLTLHRSVDPLREALIPAPLRTWILDISRMLQVPAEFALVPALSSLGSLLGHRCCLSTRAADEEHVVAPNLWGVIIGEPSSRKSPSISKGLAPYMSIASKHIERDGENAPRFTVDDATEEALALLLKRKEDGRILLATFDELAELTERFRRQGRESERKFWLRAWEGKGSKHVDRKTAEGGYVPRIALGVIGATQPDHARSMLSGFNDGFIARFGLIAWPDPCRLDSEAWKRPIDKAAKARVFELFERLDELDAQTVDAGGLPCVRFDAAAQAVWESLFTTKLQRSHDEETPSMVREWIGKSDSTVGALALILEAIAAADESRPIASISAESLIAAIDLTNHFEQHARRWFGELDGGADAAKVISEKISRREWEPVPGEAQDIRRLKQSKNWLKATSTADIRAGLAILESHGWVTVSEDRRCFWVNPVLLKTERRVNGSRRTQPLVGPWSGLDGVDLDGRKDD